MRNLLRVTSVFLFLVSGTVVAQNLSDCEKYLKENKIRNANAVIPAEDYDRPHARPVSGYIRFLGPEFENVFYSLKKSSVWIDSGGGYGLAVLEAVVSVGLKGYVINTQDFWRHFMSDGPVVSANLDKMIEICNLSGLNIGPGSRTGVSKCVKELMMRGLYNYQPGFTEQRLPEIPDRADLITDLYGAFLYSSDRPKILDLYYSKLRSNGLAFIRFRTQGQGTFSRLEEGFGVKDTIYKSKLNLIELLLKIYPNVFALSNETPGVLIVRRDPSINELNLASLLAVDSVRMENKSGMEYPFVKWRLQH